MIFSVIHYYAAMKIFETDSETQTGTAALTKHTKRIHCQRCDRPQRTCICHWIVPVENRIDVLLLQHPLEVSHVKGSARLLHLGLQHSRLVIGEQFDEQELLSLLHAPLQSGEIAAPALLYPDDDGQQTCLPKAYEPNRLVILDGTWRKSRKMLHLNPLLRALPRIGLTDLPPSQYSIRKAHRNDQLSSYEAACHALARLERDEKKYAPSLHAFEGFVSQQASYMPANKDAPPSDTLPATV